MKTIVTTATADAGDTISFDAEDARPIALYADSKPPELSPGRHSGFVISVCRSFVGPDISNFFLVEIADKIYEIEDVEGRVTLEN